MEAIAEKERKAFIGAGLGLGTRTAQWNGLEGFEIRTRLAMGRRTSIRDLDDRTEPPREDLNE